MRQPHSRPALVCGTTLGMRYRLEVRLTAADIGERVVIRWRPPGPDDSRQMTDVVGILEEADDQSFTVRRTRDGQLVVIPRTRVLAGKVVPPAPPPRQRPAARVLCLDPGGRVLLLRWRDPVDGTIFWEPPGGGLEPGESPLAAARRELNEETGLPADVVLDRWVVVQRDFRWRGRHYRGPETFFLGQVAVAEVPGAHGLTGGEEGALLGHGWFTRQELAACREPIQPPELAAILDQFGVSRSS